MHIFLSTLLLVFVSCTLAPVPSESVTLPQTLEELLDDPHREFHLHELDDLPEESEAQSALWRNLPVKFWDAKLKEDSRFAWHVALLFLEKHQVQNALPAVRRLLSSKDRIVRKIAAEAACLIDTNRPPEGIVFEYAIAGEYDLSDTSPPRALDYTNVRRYKILSRCYSCFPQIRMSMSSFPFNQANAKDLPRNGDTPTVPDLEQRHPTQPPKPQ